MLSACVCCRCWMRQAASGSERVDPRFTNFAIVKDQDRDRMIMDSRCPNALQLPTGRWIRTMATAASLLPSNSHCRVAYLLEGCSGRRLAGLDAWLAEHDALPRGALGLPPVAELGVARAAVLFDKRLGDSGGSALRSAPRGPAWGSAASTAASISGQDLPLHVQGPAKGELAVCHGGPDGSRLESEGLLGPLLKIFYIQAQLQMYT